MKLEKLEESIYSNSRSENTSHSENSRFFNFVLRLILNFFSASLSTSDPDEALVEEQEPSSSSISSEFCLREISNVVYQRPCPWAKRQYQPTFER